MRRFASSSSLVLMTVALALAGCNVDPGAAAGAVGTRKVAPKKPQAKSPSRLQLDDIDAEEEDVNAPETIEVGIEKAQPSTKPKAIDGIEGEAEDAKHETVIQ